MATHMRVSMANVTQQHSVMNCDKPFNPKGFLYRDNLLTLSWSMPPFSSKNMNKKFYQKPNQVLPTLASMCKLNTFVHHTFFSIL